MLRVMSVGTAEDSTGPTGEFSAKGQLLPKGREPLCDVDSFFSIKLQCLINRREDEAAVYVSLLSPIESTASFLCSDSSPIGSRSVEGRAPNGN